MTKTKVAKKEIEDIYKKLSLFRKKLNKGITKIEVTKKNFLN